MRHILIWILVKSCCYILLQFVPRHINLAKVNREIEDVRLFDLVSLDNSNLFERFLELKELMICTFGNLLTEWISALCTLLLIQIQMSGPFSIA